MIAVGSSRIRGIIHWIGGVWKQSSGTTSDYQPLLLLVRTKGVDYDSTETTSFTDNLTGAHYEAVEVTSNLPAKDDPPARPAIVSKLRVRRNKPKPTRPRNQRQARAPSHVPSKWLVRKHTR